MSLSFTGRRAFPIGWSTDNSEIYAIVEAATGDRRTIVAISSTGSGVRYFTIPVPKGSMEPYVDLTPDGRQIVFSLRETQSDAWILDNFDPKKE